MSEASLRMPNRAGLLRRERGEDEFVSAYKELLAVVQRVYDIGGDPQIKIIVERAHAALGRVPH